MARKFLTNIDMNDNQILNLVLQQLGSDPGSPATGQIWYNTTSNLTKYYTGSGTITLYDSATTNTGSKLILRDSSGNFAANVGTFNSVTINNSPSNATDAATKSYVDNVAQGLSPKPSAVVATTGALPSYSYANGTSGVGATITFSATGTVSVDGHTLALNDLLLVKDEAGANQPYNGLYLVTTAPAVGVAGILTRSVYMDDSTEFAGAFAFIESGTTNGKTGWIYTGTSGPTVGTDNITFGQFSAAANTTFNAPLSESGNAVSLDFNARLVNNSGNLDLASGIVTAGTYTSVTVDTYGRTTAGADITSGTGIVTKTASGTFTARTITGTTSVIAVTNGDGVSGNPTITIDSAYVGQTSITTLGTIGTGTWQATAVATGFGGTGATSASAGFNNLSPMTTLGDLIYGGTSGAGTRLAGNTTSTRKFLRQTGTGSVSAAPAWDTLQTSDLPSGTAQKYSTTITGDNSTTAFTVTHNLGTTAVIIQIRDSSGNEVVVDNDANGSNTCVITFASAPSNVTSYTVIVIG